MRRISVTYRAVGWLAVAGLVASALIGPAAGAASAAALNGAIWTSLGDGTTVNANIYAAKTDVYLNGGPQNCDKANGGLPDGDYYFQVTDPSGGDLLSSDAIKFRQVKVVNGVIDGVSGSGNHLTGTDASCGTHPVQLFPYNDTSNNGGEYSVDMAPAADVAACDGFDSGNSTTLNFVKGCNVASKNDNFKVAAAAPTPTPTAVATPTPTPTVAPTPTPTVAPTPTPTPAPGTADLTIVKVLDVDGNPATTDDQTTVAGWTFDLSAAGGTPGDASVTTAAQAGSNFPFAVTSVSIDGDSAHVTITEQQQDGFTIVDAFCFTDSSESTLGSLDGLALGLDVNRDQSYVCEFINTGGGVEAATGTPRVTPPPTDTIAATRSSGDGTRLLLLAVAGIIATLLIVTPSPASRRRR